MIITLTRKDLIADYSSIQGRDLRSKHFKQHIQLCLHQADVVHFINADGALYTIKSRYE